LTDDSPTETVEIPFATRSDRIDLACPECGHVQKEPALVISTQCQSCRCHYQVRAGKPVARILPVTRLARPGVGPVVHPAVRENAGSKAPSSPPGRRPEPASPDRPAWLRWLLREKPPREVLCFSCAHTHRARAEVQSTQCPRCGDYISLEDHRIEESWNLRLRTRGNVIITRRGSVVATHIECHDLTVLGSLSASAECSGTLRIRTKGKIAGTLRCRHLIVERGARVEFLSPVHAESMLIAGHARGQLRCNGEVRLAKRARFSGLIQAGSVLSSPGARHHGTFEPLNTASHDTPPP
jgi:cytoskeletal protein CcmA (bactofilin family)/Zn finger protein HypA/HybF involved in hydrogenase expression